MGKIINVNPSDLEKAANKLKAASENYRELYTKLFKEVNDMAAVWAGEDNRAFTDQINGFTDDLKQMTELIVLASSTLLQMKTNYVNRQDTNTSSVRKLAN